MIKCHSRISYISFLASTWVVFVLSGTGECSFAAGVTIITHGFSSGTTGWMGNWSEAIRNRLQVISGVPSLTQYTVFAAADGIFGPVSVTLGPRVGNVPQSIESGEIVFLLDWSDIDVHLGPEGRDTTTVAEAVVAQLVNPAFIPDLNGHSVVELPIHLIGHSRGGSLVCELARLLGERGIWVDQVTTLDPHPLQGGTKATGDSDGLSGPKFNWNDALPRIYTNTLFADNYWRAGEGAIPNGRLIEGAYNRDLGDLDGGYSLISGGEHSDTHLWYFGTIDLQTPASNGDGIPLTQPIRDNWWVPNEMMGAHAGFLYSRIGAGDRLEDLDPTGTGNQIRDGYHSNPKFGGDGSRESLNMSSATWPDVITLNVRRGNSLLTSGGATLELGEWIGFEYVGQDYNSSSQVYLGLDQDLNPYNANTYLEMGPNSHSSTSSSFFESSFSWQVPPGVQPDLLFPFVRVTDGAHTRYLYSGVELIPPSECSFLSVISDVWDDDTDPGESDLDHYAESGELVRAQIILMSSVDLQNVQAIISSPDASVEVREDDVIYGEMQAGIQDSGGGWFHLKINHPPQEFPTIPFFLTVTYQIDGSDCYQEIGPVFESFPCQGCLSFSPKVCRVDVLDGPYTGGDSGDGDHIPESGEEVSLELGLQNTGNAAGLEVSAFLTGVPNDGYTPQFETREKAYADLPIDGPCVLADNDFRIFNGIPQNFTGGVHGDIEIGFGGTGQKVILYNELLFTVVPAPWLKILPREWDFGVHSSIEDVTVSIRIQNVGSSPMEVTQIQPTTTTWIGPPLPWTVGPGLEQRVEVVIHTGGLGGQDLERVVKVVSANARVRYPDEDDSITIHGRIENLPTPTPTDTPTPSPTPTPTPQIPAVVLIDFDKVPLGTSISNDAPVNLLYSSWGVILSSTGPSSDGSVYARNYIPSGFQMDTLPNIQSLFLSPLATDLNDSHGRIIAGLDPPASEVTVVVIPLNENGRPYLLAYDSSGNKIGLDQRESTPNSAHLTLSVTQSANNIARIEYSALGSGSTVIFDTLSIWRILPSSVSSWEAY